jgi:hypothetical protein
MIQRKYDYTAPANFYWLKNWELTVLHTTRPIPMLQRKCHQQFLRHFTSVLSRISHQNPCKLYKFIWLCILPKDWLVKIRSCVLQMKRHRSSVTHRAVSRVLLDCSAS